VVQFAWRSSASTCAAAQPCHVLDTLCCPFVLQQGFHQHASSPNSVSSCTGVHLHAIDEPSAVVCLLQGSRIREPGPAGDSGCQGHQIPGSPSQGYGGIGRQGAHRHAQCGLAGQLSVIAACMRCRDVCRPCADVTSNFTCNQQLCRVHCPAACRHVLTCRLDLRFWHKPRACQPWPGLVLMWQSALKSAKGTSRRTSTTRSAARAHTSSRHTGHACLGVLCGTLPAHLVPSTAVMHIVQHACS
jgi:hypothetical protein